MIAAVRRGQPLGAVTCRFRVSAGPTEPGTETWGKEVAEVEAGWFPETGSLDRPHKETSDASDNFAGRALPAGRFPVPGFGLNHGRPSLVHEEDLHLQDRRADAHPGRRPPGRRPGGPPGRRLAA